VEDKRRSDDVMTTHFSINLLRSCKISSLEGREESEDVSKSSLTKVEGAG
jgi:hypothetical protein